MRRARLPALLLLLAGALGPGALPPATAQAEPDAAAALLAEVAQAAPAGDAWRLRTLRNRLRDLGEAGWRAAGARLLAVGADAPEAPHLLLVAGAAEHADVDALLAQVAGWPSATLRALAADALAQERTPGGVEVLVRLTGDALPGVRAAAWRALFAREDAPALAARARLPRDGDPDLAVRRLVLLRLRAQGGAPVRALAEQAWAHGRTPAERLAGARLLASAPVGADAAALLALVAATGRGPVAALAWRHAAGAPLSGYDAVEERWVAVEAALALLERGDAATAAALPAPARADLLDRCLDWLAHPVPMDPTRPDPIPELALRRRLPDLGAEILPALERRMEAGGFPAPRDGTTLLGELPAADVLPLLARLLAPEREQAVRAAASGALRVLGEVGDEALARRLTRAEEDAAVRRDAISALATEPRPFALAVLGELLGRSDPATVEAAADALEERREPEARALLEAYVLDGACPEHRLPPRLLTLLSPWRPQGLDLWRRALASRRGPLRRAALSLGARLPLARLTDLLDDLRAHAPRLAGAAEVEAWVPAMLRGAPAEGLAWMQAHWDDAPVGASLPSTRCRMLAALEHVRDAAHATLAVDLALAKAGDADDPQLLQHAVDAFVGRSGVRDAEVDAFFARLLTGRGVAGDDDTRDEVAAAAVAALERPGRGDLTGPLLALLARTAPDPDRSHRATAVLRALAHQPAGPVEAPVLTLALDGTLPSPVRAAACWLLAGRVSPAGRGRLLAALLDAGRAESEPQVLLALAAAAGTGATPEEALRLSAALREALLGHYADDAALDPDAERQDALPQRVQALAAGVAASRHAPALDPLAALLIEPRFARWAQRVLEQAWPRPNPPDALSTLMDAVPEPLLRLEDASTSAALLPPEVSTLTIGLKALADDDLAASLARALAADARAPDGGLARFPDGWPAKLALLLHDPQSGGRPAAAALLEAQVERLEPLGSVFDLALARHRAEAAEAAGRPEEAAREHDRARRLLARRGLELVPGLTDAWLRLRADAAGCRAQAQAAAGDEPGALAAFERAWAGLLHDAPTLARAARRLARAGTALDLAESLAGRALALDRRADGEERLASSVAAAEVLLVKHRPGAAARRLEGALERARRSDQAPHLYLLAVAHAEAGDVEGAARALRRALLLAPGLAARARDDARLAPLAEDGLLERVLREAAEALAAGAED